MNKRIKILFTIPNFDTAGSGKVVYDLVKGLDKSIFEPEICCFHNKGEFFKTIQELGVKIHLFQFASPYRPFITFPFRVLKIYRFFKSNQFDVIHSWHWSSDISEPLAAKLAGIPFVYTKKAMGWGNRSWRWRSKLSTKIIAINKDMMSQFFSKMKDKVTQIPLGVDIDYFRPMPKTYITPEGINIDKSDFVIVSVANLVPVKGLEVLLNAVKQIHDKSIKVFIIGNGQNEYAQELKFQFSSDTVYFLGKQLDVRPYLAMADVFVIPTKDEGRKEGLPIAPLEAMAMGKIVIGSNISGINDLLKKFSDYLFDAGNVNDLKKKIISVKSLSDSSKFKLEAQIRQYVEDNYTVTRFVSEHEKLFKSLM